jgi:hypothetical protein
MRRNFGRWLSTAIADNLGWRNDRFIEIDPMEILGWSHQDGLDLEFAVVDIEARLGRCMSREQVEHMCTLCLGEAVDYVLNLPSP